MGFLRDLVGRWGARKAAEERPGSALDPWRVFQLQGEGTTAVMRIRVERPSLPDGAAFHTAILVEWPYESDTAFPPPEVRLRMDELETAIDELTGGNGFSELVLVRTGGGKRDWLFYVSDLPRFKERFNALVAGRPAYPVRISMDQDPEWRLWKDMVESFGPNARR